MPWTRPWLRELSQSGKTYPRDGAIAFMHHFCRTLSTCNENTILENIE